MSDILTVILAAGQGTRMKSDLPKVLHQIAGKPMVKHIIDQCSDLSSEIVCVVGYQAQQVKTSINEEEKQIKFVRQKEQLGTGHAVLQAKNHIKKHQGPVLVLYGDTPLITSDTITKMIDYHETNQAGVTILTANVDQPEGYGRIIRDDKDKIIKIVEEDDASDKEKKINEVNTGVYCFDSSSLNQTLQEIDNNNAQDEYYLTDTISNINQKGKDVIPVVTDNPQETIGVNTRQDLACAEKIYRRRVNKKHMDNGVTIIDPDSTFIDAEVEIGRDTIIYPFTYIEGNSKIGSNTVIGPHCRLVNAELGQEIELKSNCNIWNSIIKNNCTIGPFAYIRPGSEIEKEAKVGDFVELKKAKIGKGTKVPHLSYVGDARIGKNTNIGAGTIFANYDGQNKHETRIGDSVFVGSNTTLIAPVTVQDEGKTGAGAVVTKDVPEDTVVIGVPARIYQEEQNQEES